jgi:hypothetical protein
MEVPLGYINPGGCGPWRIDRAAGRRHPTDGTKPAHEMNRWKTGFRRRLILINHVEATGAGRSRWPEIRRYCGRRVAIPICKNYAFNS